MARNSRNPAAGLLHHSDRGVQYAALDFQRALARLEAVQSMSRKGDCWDNAVVESFFASLKCELDLENPIGSRADTRAMVFEWIEVWYNRERRHSSLGFLSPLVFEERFHTLNCPSTKSALRHFWCKLERQFNRAVQLFNPCVIFKVAQDFETPPLPKGCCLERARVKSTGNHLHQK